MAPTRVTDRFAAARGRRRRRALRGLRPLPVPRVGAQEPGPLAVRRARPAPPGRARPAPSAGRCAPSASSIPAPHRRSHVRRALPAGASTARSRTRPADGRFSRSTCSTSTAPTWVAWDEAVEHDIAIAELELLPLRRRRTEVPVDLPGGGDVEELAPVAGDARRPGGADPAGRRRSGARRDVVGRRARAPSSRSPSPSRTSPTGARPRPPRDEVMRRSLVAVHTMLAVDDGTFVSLLDPPPVAAEAVAGCAQRRHLPGAHRTARMTSCCRLRSSSTTSRRSPRRAPVTCSTPPRSTRSSRLRVLTLTDEEKAEATRHRRPGSGDRRPLRRPCRRRSWARLHGAIRSIAPCRRAGSRRADAVVGPGRRPLVDPWTETGRRSPASTSPRARRSSSALATGGPTPTTCSWPGWRPPSPACSATPRANCTSPSRSTTTRPTRSWRGRAATCSSVPTRSSVVEADG